MEPLKPQPAFSDLEIGIMAYIAQYNLKHTCSTMPQVSNTELGNMLPKCYTRGMNSLEMDSCFERARKRICNFNALQLAYRESEASIEAQMQKDGCAIVEITQFVENENCLGQINTATKTKSKTKSKTKTVTKSKTVTNTDANTDSNTNSNTNSKTKTKATGVKRPHSE
jgi:hypothetical protein